MFTCSAKPHVVLYYYITDGLIFHRSANNVILSAGNDDGLILPKYFAKVQEHPSGKAGHLKHQLLLP